MEIACIFPELSLLFREAWIRQPWVDHSPRGAGLGREKLRTLVPSWCLCSDSFGTDSPEAGKESSLATPMAVDFGAPRVTWRESCLPIPL